MAKSIGVFGGAEGGGNDLYMDEAYKLGYLLAYNGCNLNYGGGSTGIMGALSKGFLEVDRDIRGKCHGIITNDILPLEKPQENLDFFTICDHLQDRQRLLYKISDAFVLLPGGIGSLYEFIEVLAWKSHTYHTKPLVIVNTRSYWDKMFELFDVFYSEGFIRSGVRLDFEICYCAADVMDLI